jgi:hypothetical protein
MEGLEARDLGTGVRYLRLHHYADPEKGEAWLDGVRREMADTPREFRREILMDEEMYEGDPVFSSFVGERHAPERFRAESVPVVEGSVFYGGWDCGNTHQPAFALAQVTPGRQVHWVFEVVPSRPMAMAQFAPLVRQKLKGRLPGHWTDVLHFGDESGGARSGTDFKSAFDVARESGFVIRPVSNAVDAREAAIEWLLTDWLSQDGPSAGWVPRCFYGAFDCPVLVQGMRGAYCPRTEGSGGAMQVQRPVKNFWSHVNDAHQYAAVRIRQAIAGRELRVSDRRVGA